MSQMSLPPIYRSVSVCSHKGGSAKTTTTTALASLIASKGGRVLLVDLCPQANASQVTGADHNPTTILDVFTTGDPAVAAQAITRSPWSDGYDIAEAGGVVDVIGGDLNLENEVTAEHVANLRRALAPLSSNYHLVLFDLPPSVGPIVQSALIASQGVMIVVDPESFAMRGLQATVDVINRVYETWGGAGIDTAVIMGVLVTRFAVGLADHQDTVDEVRKWAGQEFIDPPIPRRTIIPQVQKRNLPIQAAGARAKDVIPLYSFVAARLLKQFDDPATKQLALMLAGDRPSLDELGDDGGELTAEDIAHIDELANQAQPVPTGERGKAVS